MCIFWNLVNWEAPTGPSLSSAHSLQWTRCHISVPSISEPWDTATVHAYVVGFSPLPPAVLLWQSCQSSFRCLGEPSYPALQSLPPIGGDMSLQTDPNGILFFHSSEYVANKQMSIDKIHCIIINLLLRERLSAMVPMASNIHLLLLLISLMVLFCSYGNLCGLLEIVKEKAL